MNKEKKILNKLKNEIWANRFNLTIREKHKFDEILLFVIHNNIYFKNDKQKEEFLNYVFFNK
tara:strand:+ start:601 stop:786 length:186 start_codon:yes stop_codon:yes gene_type:complete